jgi:leader peptidase (prepilin peptidase)/N-methyltransferase
VPDESLCPNLANLLLGTAAVAAVSFATLSASEAFAATLLGALMIAGAEVDTRTFLLPDLVTGGTFVAGVLAAAIVDPFDPLAALGLAALRGIGTAGALYAMRWSYARWRGREGLGLGDVKLAAGIGAWLPLEAIPLCFALATFSALGLVLLAHWRGEPLQATSRLQFGAFLCPALWLTFYLGAWGG